MSRQQRVRDPARLAAVRATGLLDTGPEEAFDRFSRLASILLDAPFAFVTVVDETRSYWKSCIGIDSTDPADRQNTVEESFCQYVLDSGERLVVGDTRANPLTRDNPSIESMGVAAWAGFPVLSPGGHVLGTFCVVDTTPRDWSARDEQVLETLAQAVSGEIGLRAALLDAEETNKNLRRSGEQMAALVEVLQESLVPVRLPAVPGLDVADRYVGGKRGGLAKGRFYDIFPVPRGWAVVMGDVAGHGVPAARTSSLARHTFRAAAQLHPAPSDVLRAVNHAIRSDGTTGLAMLSALYLRLRPRPDGRWDAILAGGGHPPPVLLRADGTADRVKVTGPVLGRDDRPAFGNTPLLLLPGDAIVLYTSGVEPEDSLGTEAGGGSAAEICDSLVATATQVVEPSDEGVAVVVVRVPRTA